jgi:hypothetical protein
LSLSFRTRGAQRPDDSSEAFLSHQFQAVDGFPRALVGHASKLPARPRKAAPGHRRAAGRSGGRFAPHAAPGRASEEFAVLLDLRRNACQTGRNGTNEFCKCKRTRQRYCCLWPPRNLVFSCKSLFSPPKAASQAAQPAGKPWAPSGHRHKGHARQDGIPG